MQLPLLQKLTKRDDGFQSMVGGNRVALMHDGDFALNAMAAAIAAAEREVLLEMYWFASDVIGTKIANLLADKARQGVGVKILYDAVGSWDTDPRMFNQLREAGCQVREYHPVAPWRRRFKLSLINYRDHRKILVVDNRIGMTGGINICDMWCKTKDGSSGWRDDAIQVEGPVVEQLRDVFFDTWNGMASRTYFDKIFPSRIKTAVPKPEQGSVPSAETCSVAVLANRYRSKQGAIRRAYMAQIYNARTSIYISNSYFVPDRYICRALAQAAKRGVDVRVLVPEVCDVMAVYYASQRMFSWLLKRGVKLYLWPKNVLHTKTAVIDGVWSTLGTHNLDHRSWRHNLEVNVAIEDAGVGVAMQARFMHDLEQSQRILLESWRYRPLYLRLLERFFYAFRWLL